MDWPFDQLSQGKLQNSHVLVSPVVSVFILLLDLLFLLPPLCGKIVPLSFQPGPDFVGRSFTEQLGLSNEPC